MTPSVNRRQFLKTALAALAVVASPVPPAWARVLARRGTVYPPGSRPLPGGVWDPDVPVRMGRAIHASTVYAAPSGSSERVGAYGGNATMFIRGEVRAPGLNAHNDLWYETPDGYVHSAWIQPLRVYPLQPTRFDFGEFGFWGEIASPWTDARSAPSFGASIPYRFYGNTTYHVVDAYVDDNGIGWYKIFDELPPTTHHWVFAGHVRRIPPEEMSPIAPFAGDKRMAVDLTRQQITCYQNDQIVYQTLCAAGLGHGINEDGTPRDLATPTGQMAAILKQVTRHMANRPQKPDDPVPSDLFDLPGIPWNTFFDLSGTAIHGAYWHNDYGIRRSHGCLNVSFDAARWIYRWTHPIGGYEDDFVRGRWGRLIVGTPIEIFE